MSFWAGWKKPTILLAKPFIGPALWVWTQFKLVTVAVYGFIMLRPVATCVLGLIAAAIITHAYRDRHELRDYLENNRDGRIVVNSPTVYTRQRLVNDRLDQARWLRTQLEFTEAKGREAEFQSIDAVRHTLQSTRFAATAGSPQQHTTKETTETTLPSGKEAIKPPGSPKQQEGITVSPTTMSLFRSKSAYRDEVRSEITQTELDDRHDINGNTIFRLTFDTSVIAGTNTEAVAAVVVRLDHKPESEQSVLRTIYEKDYRDLYHNWAGKFQETISTSLSSVTNSINSSAPQLHLRLNFTDFLLRRICQFMNGDLDTNKFPENCSGDEDKAERLLALYTRTRLSLLQKIKDYNFVSAVAQIDRAKYEVPTGDMIAAAAKACLSPDNKDDQIALWQLGITLKPQGPSDRRTGGATAATSLVGETSDDKSKGSKKAAQPEKQKADAATQRISCPFSDSLKERLISGVLLYEKIHALKSDSPTERPSTGALSGNAPPPTLQNTQLDSNEKSAQENAIANLPPLTSLPAPAVPVNWFVKQHSGPADNEYAAFAQRIIGDLNTCRSGACQVQPARLQCFAADFLKSKLGYYLDPFDYKKRKIADFLTLKIVGREVNDCSIHVLPIADMGSDQFGKFIKWFRGELNENTDAFAYSVTPKNLSENIATAAETRDAYELLLKTEQSPTNIASFLRAQAKHQRAIINHPVVVGFGKSVPTIDAKNNEIRFGWVIAGRLAEQGSYEQIDGQYPLSAYISVPGWWQTVKVSVQTCWVSRTKLAKLPSTSPLDEVCPDAPLQNPIPVRLPPAIPEISHKLGFDVVQQPSIFNPVQRELIIGQPGSLLIEGQRLWRSTEVTADSQRADKITVLPNMEGILAEFDCVLPPAGNREQLIGETLDQSQTITRSNIRVWTSEGIAEPIPLVFVWPKNATKDFKAICDKRNAGQFQNSEQNAKSPTGQNAKQAEISGRLAD